MNEEEKEAIAYLKVRLYENEGCEWIDVAQEDLRIFLKIVGNQKKGLKQADKIIEEQDEEIIKKNNKICKLKFSIEKQQKEIDKQNKVIDEMAKDIYDLQMDCGRYFEDKEEVKEHFIRKVEEDEQ